MSRSVIQAKQNQKKKLTSAQKKFNAIIRKIDKQKKLLADWLKMSAEFQEKRAGIYVPLMERYNALQCEQVNRFDKFFARKSFSNKQREKMADFICETSQKLIPQGFEELRDIHDRYSEMDFKSMEKEDEVFAKDMLRSFMEEEFDMNVDEDMIDVHDPQKTAERLFERFQEEQQLEDERKKSQDHKKTKAQQRREARKQKEEENLSQSIKSVYRQLTTKLHPDRETDAEEQKRKTELMQAVTRAYRDKDLLKLLELQLEVEQIDQHKIDNIADERLKHFNKILSRQLHELQAEIDSISMAFAQMSGMIFGQPTPDKVMQQFVSDTHELEKEVMEIEHDLASLTSVKSIQQWLKNYHLPSEAELFDDFFVIPSGFGH